MKIIKLNLRERSYNIITGTGILERHFGNLVRKLNMGDNAYIITNNIIKAKYGKMLVKSLRLFKINDLRPG